MPQPLFRVSPASWTFPRMSSIESPMVPDTVQLIVEVAGLCSRAPALDVTRPAGIAPRRNAQRKCSYHCSRTSVDSTSASARATRLYVSSIVLSMGDPSFAVRRYFLSQISSEASWKEMASRSLGSIFTTVFMNPRRSDCCTPDLRISGCRCDPLNLPRSLILGRDAQTQDLVSGSKDYRGCPGSSRLAAIFCRVIFVHINHWVMRLSAVTVG